MTHIPLLYYHSIVMLQVPKQALTVGVGTVMDARQVMVLITGAHKAYALRMAIEEGVSHMWTVSAFQQHPKVFHLYSSVSARLMFSLCSSSGSAYHCLTYESILIHLNFCPQKLTSASNFIIGLSI